MRHNVAISTLLARSVGLSAADETKEIILRQGGLGAGTGPSPVVSFASLPSPATIYRLGNSTFRFEADNVLVNAVKLKVYDGNGWGDGSNDKLLAATTTTYQSPTPTPTPAPGDQDLSRLFSGDTSLKLYHDNVVVEWGDNQHNPYLDLPLYLECEWANSSVSGNSASQLFAVYNSTPDLATHNLQATNLANDAPARDQVINPIPSSPSHSSTVPTATSSTPATSQPAATLGLGSSSSPAPSGLSRAGIIGVAVGISVAGLLVAGVLAWLFCAHRRSRRSRRDNAATHHMMPSYGSDVGVRTMMPDKEMPAVLAASSSSPQSVYDGRPSTDLYAPYSDRSTAPPPRGMTTTATTTTTITTTGGTATVPAPAPAPADTSETDLARNRGAPMPASVIASVIASRYAHLVEEGMTEDEIRRLEEEERQLDAAIEADRRGTS